MTTQHPDAGAIHPSNDGSALLDGDLADWLAQLPADDPGAICDVAAGRPVRWDEERGWLE